MVPSCGIYRKELQRIVGVFKGMPSLPATSLFFMILLYATWAKQVYCFEEECLEDCQELMNAYEKEMNSYWNVNKLPPKLNTKHYIREMAVFISESGRKGRQVLVVGGPRDSGKTTGILFLSQAAIKVGYYVIHLNLKTTIGSSNIKRQMKYFYSDLLNGIIGMDSTNCILYNILSCPDIQRTWSGYFVQVMQLLVTISVGGGLAYLIQKTLALRWPFIMVLFIIMIAFLYLVTYHIDILYQLSFFVLQLEERVSNGDWSTIFCSLDAIKKCHSMAPILFIRDIKRFEPDHLHEFFGHLHQVKEKFSIITFPVILETSDNLWMSEAYTDTSNSAFAFYYLPSMSYVEGKEEMVVKYPLFDNKTYDNLYLQFGGHVRFYVKMWEATNRRRSYDRLIQESKIIFNTCMMKIREQNIQNEVINLNVYVTKG